jgi:hypothetical protein
MRKPGAYEKEAPLHAALGCLKVCALPHNAETCAVVRNIPLHAQGSEPLDPDWVGG